MIEKRQCENCIRTLETKQELEKGICSDCEENTINFSERNWEELKKEFTERLQSYRDKGDQYDCLVPLSGGKDSTYVLYYMTQIQKARAHAYTYQNFFQRGEANVNVQKAVRSANVPSLVYDAFESEEWKRAYRALMRNDAHPCSFCHTLRTPMLYNLCLEKKIPLVVYGTDHTQAESMPFLSSDWHFSVEERFDIHKKRATLILKELESTFRGERDLLDKVYSQVPYFKSFVDGKIEPNDFPAFVSLGQYHNWRLDGEDSFLQILKDFCDYVPVGHTKENTNCSLERLRVYVENRRGEDSYPVRMLSKKVREDEINRDLALQELQTYQVTGEELEKTIQEFCDKVEMTPQTLNNYLTSHTN